MAAGEGKASIIQAAIEGDVHRSRPASALHSHRGARFYLTHGAANMLSARRAERISRISSSACVDWALHHLSGAASASSVPPNYIVPPEDYLLIETLLYDISLATKRPVHTLTPADMTSMVAGGAAGAGGPVIEGVAFPSFFLHDMTFAILVACAARRLREKVVGGLLAASPQGLSILHTA